MDDPEPLKPDDWDEDAPSRDPGRGRGEGVGWLDDESWGLRIRTRRSRENWDADEDGDWEAPVVPNPACAEAPGCGEWTRPTKYNPDYKGKWYPPMIDNPAYKGPWVPRKIPNPNFFEDESRSRASGRLARCALEIWTMSSGLVVDNVLVAADEKAALELGDRLAPEARPHQEDRRREREKERGAFSASVCWVLRARRKNHRRASDFAADLLPRSRRSPRTSPSRSCRTSGSPSSACSPSSPLVARSS